MKNIGIVLLGISLVAFCCNSINTERKGSGNSKINAAFAGNWISKNYIDSLYKYGTPAQVKDVMCEEIVINFSCDSLCKMLPGADNMVFQISEKNDSSFRVSKYNMDDNCEFFLSKNKKELSCKNKKENTITIFKKMEKKYAVKMVGNWPSATELFLNENVIAAKYFLINVENKRGSEVAFTSYGKIFGLPGYTDYSICYGGACRNMSSDDLITLGDNRANDNFIWDWKNDTLIFYSTSNIAKQNEQPRYVKGTDIFRFKKKM